MVVGSFPAGYFVLDAGVSDLMAVFDEQLPDSLGSKLQLSGLSAV